MSRAGQLERRIAADYERIAGAASPPIQIEFYSYAGLHHTVRERGGRLCFRFSDLLESESNALVRVTARLLLAKLLRTPASRNDRVQYKQAVSRPEFRSRVRETRRKRGHKLVDSPRGKVHDLERRFARLNALYFHSEVEIRILGWSRRRSRRVLGHYDQAMSAIVINSALDNPLVPDFVIDYVLFHEMLHARLGEEQSAKRRIVHHRRFLEAERAFPDYERANRFIRENLAVKVD